VSNDKTFETVVTLEVEPVKEKYDSYVQGYKIEQGLKKPIQAYIIQMNDKLLTFL
jgi:hypothetical protein